MSITKATPAASSSSYDQGASSSASSWMRPLPLSQSHNKRKLDESDEDVFTVPDVEGGAPQLQAQATDSTKNTDLQCTSAPKRRRGRNPADREYRRLKRLLRNRVSAQQARERKKVYVSDLESRANELYDKNSKLEEKISTLVNENTMLRKVLMNTRPKVDESSDPS